MLRQSGKPPTASLSHGQSLNGLRQSNKPPPHSPTACNGLQRLSNGFSTAFQPSQATASCFNGSRRFFLQRSTVDGSSTVNDSYTLNTTLRSHTKSTCASFITLRKQASSNRQRPDCSLHPTHLASCTLPLIHVANSPCHCWIIRNPLMYRRNLQVSDEPTKCGLKTTGSNEQVGDTT